jgi:RNA polymerase sigma-70 factor, ECF subfamily
VLVLRDAFDYPFAEIAAVIDKSEANTRQILSRAHRHVEAERPRFDPDPQARFALAERFLAAARDGDMDGLVAMLADDAALTGDGGGRATALPRPLVGATAVAKAIRAFWVRGVGWGVSFAPGLVNGQPGFRTLDREGRVVSVFTVEIVDGRIARLYAVTNPDKLSHLGPTSDVALR